MSIAANTFSTHRILLGLRYGAKQSIEKYVVFGVAVYRVEPNEIAPEHTDGIFFHIHGGNYVLGGDDNAESEAVQVAASSGNHAISVDYGMPSESPFPLPLTIPLRSIKKC